MCDRGGGMWEWIALFALGLGVFAALLVLALAGLCLAR